MKTAQRRTRTGPKQAGRKARNPGYHHGALKLALLKAAERILERDGIQGLTLRAAAREAGVSHAAPKNHFGDLSGLLSELAAVGFERFAAAMRARIADGDAPDRYMDAIGHGYVAFARAHPGLFLLMFRGERLDLSRPALRDAVEASSRVLSSAVEARRGEQIGRSLTLPQATAIAAAWSLVHGFSMLLLDGRLKGLLARLPAGTDADALLAAILGAAKAKR